MRNIALMVVFLSLAIFIVSCAQAPVNSATATIFAAMPARQTNPPILLSPTPVKTMENMTPACHRPGWPGNLLVIDG